MKQFLSVVLSTTLASTIVAQAGATRTTDATKPIQPSESAVAIPAPAQTQARELKLPAATRIDIEASYTVNSFEARQGDLLSFRVLTPVKIDGVTVIEKDALVTGQIVQAKRGKHWGRAGKLIWTMQDVVAVDGSRIPIRAAGDDDDAAKQKVRGDSHGGEVATKTLLLGALMISVFPLAPLALMQGFKRGENAVLAAGKHYAVFVTKETRVGIR